MLKNTKNLFQWNTKPLAQKVNAAVYDGLPTTEKAWRRWGFLPQMLIEAQMFNLPRQPRYCQYDVLVAQLAFQKYKTNFILQKNAKDNFYRKLAQVLDLQFIYRETAHYYGTEGQESIDPVVLVFFSKTTI